MLEQLKGRLVVSCQALPEEPLHSSFIMGRMALAAQMGGAAAIRAQGTDDIVEIQAQVSLPIIGLIKRNDPGSEVYITPTHREIDALLQTGCEMIALDATSRARPNGETLAALIAQIHAGGALVMADCSVFEEGVQAQALGADCVSTTLSGYTKYSPAQQEPDFALIASLAKQLHIPVFAEGRIHAPAQLARAFEAGAYAAVVGGAITRPMEITSRFCAVCPK